MMIMMMMMTLVSLQVARLVLAETMVTLPVLVESLS